MLFRSPTYKGIFWLPIGTTFCKNKDGKDQISIADGWHYLRDNDDLAGPYASDRTAADKYGTYLANKTIEQPTT